MKKPEENDAEKTDSPVPVAGDVIGDTAYSERFVLKILLKLANLDTLKNEINESAFESDLCTLWDMTAEKDVVLFLNKHNAFNLFTFALPEIDSARVFEIIIGIIGNMCCHKEIADLFLQMDDLLAPVLACLRTSDSQILNQLLRLISSCLFLADEDNIATWMTLFDNIGYADVLYFILKNSSNKELLISALENLNTLCSKCNIDKFSFDFSSQFVTENALDSVFTGYTELTNNHNCDNDTQDRINIITLQMAIHLLGFGISFELYLDNRDAVVAILHKMLTSYEHKIVENRKIDTDCVDIIDSANTVINLLQMNKVYPPDKYFTPSYKIWKAVSVISDNTQNSAQSFEDDDREKLKEFFEKIKTSLSILMCHYMAQCIDDYLLQGLDKIGKDYDSITSNTGDKELKGNISKRADNYQTRLNENVDS